MKNYSKQREQILETVKNSYSHPTAEEVYEIVKQNNSTASRSTVYRNLNLLVDEGIISKISMSIGPDRYDYFRKPHNHAICKICGKVFDFEYDFKSKELEKYILSQTGVDTQLDTITIEGICSNCK